MSLLVYTWPYALFFWGVFIWVFAPEVRVVSGRAEPTATPYDAHSKRLIVIGQGLAMFAAFGIAVTGRVAALPHRTLLFWFGLGAMIGGGLLRRHCKRMLGSSFTGAVIVTPQQTVVNRGAYRYVRHPSYTAGAILFVGVGLALGNWLSVIVLAVVVGVVYGYRVRVEERALLAVLGDPYHQYMMRTQRFVPFLL
jgi:protein-S-isoprenylcysteine O-methyltransferase Ste14